jgi:hypothetical protein
MKAAKFVLAITAMAGLFFIDSCRKTAKETSVVDEIAKPSKIDEAGLAATPIQVYGVWHAGNDYCIWGTQRTISEFDSKNHWLIDRGDGSGLPSVNVVVLSFVHPLKLLNKTNDPTTENGVPKGMTQDIVNYFKNKGVRVMLSIGGITYVDAWDQALAAGATQLGLNAAAVAQRLGVGVEIDYEQNRNPKLDSLQKFIDAYRSMNPYDATGNNHAARLTIDLAAGDRWLIDLCRKATADWLSTSNAVLDYANAMVPSRQPSATGAIANWQEHIDGKPQYGPPIPPLAPAKFTGSLWLVSGKAIPECNNFANSLQNSTSSFVQSAASKIPNTTNGMLGFMFWAAECEGTRTVCTTPPNTCENGTGKGAAVFGVPIPMQGLRQQ